MTPKMMSFGQLQALQLSTPDGASAIISLYGAHLLSWKTADGRERLFCSTRSSLDGSRPIRGGIPLIFPQFATQGTGQRHGFARTSTWALEECGSSAQASFAEFVLGPQALSDELAQTYPCRLSFRVNLSNFKLDLQFQVDNVGQTSFDFACALHSYFALDDIGQCQISGLQGQEFIEQADSPASHGQQAEEFLQCSGKIDRIYQNLTRPLRLQAGAQVLNLQQSGFSDAVVWNPWQADAAALADMADEEYQRFICVEAAALQKRSLGPGQSWLGRHSLLASTAAEDCQD